MSDDGTIAPGLDEQPGAGGDRRAAEIAEHERQFREILEYCPAGLNVVDEDGRLLFHNARLRRLMGYDEEEMHLFDTKRFWHDLDHRARIIERLRERGGELLDEEAVWKTKEGRLTPRSPTAAVTSASSAASASCGSTTSRRCASARRRSPSRSASS